MDILSLTCHVIYPIRNKEWAAGYMSRVKEIGPGWGYKIGSRQHIDGIYSHEIRCDYQRRRLHRTETSPWQSNI